MEVDALVLSSVSLREKGDASRWFEGTFQFRH